MKQQNQKRRNINFRQTASDRSATRSYQAFGKFVQDKFSKIVKQNIKQGK